MNNNVMFSSKTDVWATPQRFFDELNSAPFPSMVVIFGERKEVVCYERALQL